MEATEQKILEFFNSAQTPSEIVEKIKDDPHYQNETPRAYGIRKTLAERIIKHRDLIPGGKFKSLADINAIRGIGKDTFHDIFYSFRDSSIPSSEPDIPNDNTANERHISNDNYVDESFITQLILDLGTKNSIIHIPGEPVIDLTGKSEICVAEGVKFTSDKGINGCLGPRIICNVSTFPLFYIKGINVLISGFQIIGPNPFRFESNNDPDDPENWQSPEKWEENGKLKFVCNENGEDSIHCSLGIKCVKSNFELNNCELSGWNYAAVLLENANNVVVENNFFHHNKGQGYGYGVAVRSANALIIYNYFHHCRHAITGTGEGGTRYEACHNVFSDTFYHYPIDMHEGSSSGRIEDAGLAGDLILIHHNTIYSKQGRPKLGVINIEGVPKYRSEIYNNRFHIPKNCAVTQKFHKDYAPANIPDGNFMKINVEYNRFETQRTGRTNLICRNTNGDMLLYPFRNDTFYNGGGTLIGNGWEFTHYFLGNWMGNGNPDLIVRTGDGDLLLMPYKNGTYYDNGGGVRVGNGWDFTHYFVGDWTGNGNSDLIVRNNDGDMILYPFRDGTFYDKGGGVRVGNGWDFTHYFVGDWMGNGSSDLIVRNNDGDLILYPFRDGTFYDKGGGGRVGNGWDFTHYFVADWMGNGSPDLIVRNNDGDLILYPFRDGTFYDKGGGIRVGNGWNFTHYFMGDWTGNGSPDLLVRTLKGDILLFPFENGTFYNPWGGQVGHGFNFTDHFVGK